MPPVMEKEDFVDSVRASMNLDMLQRFTLAPNSTDERLKGVLMATMLWGSQESSRNNLFLYYRHAAEYIKMSFMDHLLTSQQERVLKAHSIDELLYLVWDTVEAIRNDPTALMEHKEVLKYIRERFADDKPL